MNDSSSNSLAPPPPLPPPPLLPLPPSDGSQSSSPAPTSSLSTHDNIESSKSRITTITSHDKLESPDGDAIDSTKLSQTQKMLQQLLKDPLLSDLAKLNNEDNISLEEVDTLIALETGTAFEIRIERDGLEPIVVRQNSTIADIKKLIKFKIEHQRKQNIQPGSKRKISWKYIWKTYCLIFEKKRLLQDKMPIQEYGIRSGSVLRFSRFIGKQAQQLNRK
ncbi:13769_t:CDS:2 [Acaulospora morrowiae]|uniref:13769_t:CDS:1 n=1 Tax=Acaulospora morrowiae TaxID=94023 RepID=A0A9N9I2H5_9GLOM|nr:13769_t:CDS:2 [Acaulospora morrowiae]